MPAHRRKRLLPLALGLAWLLAGGAAPAVAATDWAEGQVIVDFEPGATADERRAILASLDAEVIRAYHNIPAALCRLRSGTTRDAVLAKRQLPGLRLVEPNGALRLDGIPDDPLFGSQLYLHRVAGRPGLPGADIRAVHAWDVERGSRDVVVGVIDLNIDIQHPDLVDHIYTNLGEIPGNHLDDDGNGWIDDVHGPQPPVASADGHGTACAGIIAAATGNGVGIAGLADVTILPLRLGWVSNYHGPWVAAVIEAADYAIDMGVDVISLSAGDVDAEYLALHDIFAAAGQHGIYMVMSAGNDQGQMTRPHFPACFEDIDRIISVGATDAFDNVAFNWHPAWVDLAAPAVVNATCAVGGGYTSFGGTSAAAPQVAGVLALILSKFGDRPGFDAKARLLATVDVLPSLAGRNLTGGRLNAFLAVADADDVAPAPVAWLATNGIVSTGAVVHWPATGDDGASGRASSYDLRLSTGPIDEANFAQATPVADLPYPSAPGTLQSAPLAGLEPNTTYHLAMRVLDEWGAYRQRLGGDVAPNASALTVATFTTITAPAIELAPTTIKVALARGRRETRTFTVGNRGQDELEFSARVVEGADEATCAPASGRLAAGASATVAVTVAPLRAPCGPVEWTVEVRSNDPAASRRTVRVVPDVLSGAVATPTSTRLDFGVVAVGESRVLAPALRNDGCEPLLVRDITLDGSGEFTYRGPAPLDGPWFEVPPGGEAALPIEYRPVDAGGDKVLVTVATSVAATPVVTLRATGRGDSPPQAVFGATAVTSRTMYTGAADTVRLRLGNAGGADLTFAVAGSLPDWLQVVPASGVVSGRTSRQLAFVFSAAGRCAADSVTVVIATNDAAAPATPVPARLRALPACHLRVSPLVTFTYDLRSQPLVIWNDGCADHPLTITAVEPRAAGDVTVDGPHLQVIEPGQFGGVVLTSGDCWGGDGYVHIESDDPDQPVVEVPFSYYCWPEPERAARAAYPALAPGAVAASPNPFNPATTLRLALDREATVAACVFDLAGRCVWRSELGARGPGLVEAEWRGQGADGARLPSGTYFCRFDLGGGRWSARTKVTLLK